MVGHGCRDFVRRAPVDEHLDREGPAAVAARAATSNSANITHLTPGHIDPRRSGPGALPPPLLCCAQ
jgi:hypothetical protein